MYDKTLVYPLNSISKHSLKKIFFCTVKKKLMLYLFTEKEGKVIQKIIDKLAFFQFLTKYRK